MSSRAAAGKEDSRRIAKKSVPFMLAKIRQFLSFFRASVLKVVKPGFVRNAGGPRNGRRPRPHPRRKTERPETAELSLIFLRGGDPPEGYMKSLPICTTTAETTHATMVV